MTRLLHAAFLAAALFTFLLSCGPTRTPDPHEDESARLRAAVTREGVMEHVRRLQEIADQNGGDRAVGTPGYDASADYVARRLRGSGYEVTVQRFGYAASTQLSAQPRRHVAREQHEHLAVGVPFDRDDPGPGDVLARSGYRETTNIIAETNVGDCREAVVVGAHLDSVPEGPGINDNGSGSAAILEIAEEMSELGIRPCKVVRFAFWGAEEVGLRGSTHYVKGLSRQEIEDISVYLNFDMLGSPNGGRLVYDDAGNPPGSERIEETFTEYFASHDLASEPDDTLVGRSDHGPFADRGVPVGGLFSGAEGDKTAQEARDYGGERGEPHDSCYHEACDDARNLDLRLLDEMADAAAHATLHFAEES